MLSPYQRVVWSKHLIDQANLSVCYCCREGVQHEKEAVSSQRNAQSSFHHRSTGFAGCDYHLYEGQSARKERSIDPHM
jgi:hypothetical protein